MGKHSMPRPSLFRRIFCKTWEVTSDKYSDIDRFKTYKAAKKFADDINNPDLYEPGDFDGPAVYTISRRKF